MRGALDAKIIIIFRSRVCNIRVVEIIAILLLVVYW